MQTLRKTTNAKERSKLKSSKDDASTISKKSQEEKLTRSVYSVSTPRNYVPKSTTADIYVQKRKSVVQATKTPKKVLGTTNNNSNVSPMKDLLKSSPSTISVSSKFKSSPSTNVDVKSSSRVPTARKNLSHTNVTVNSPVVNKKIAKDYRKSDSKEARTNSIQESSKKSSNMVSKEVDRQRAKTKTLSENEVKILNIDAVDNNAEMQKLSRKLAAKPKAFFVEWDEKKKGLSYVYEIKKETKEAQDSKTSEDEVSYEDDFESYESDFDSYHESQSENSDNHTSEENADANDIDEDALNEIKPDSTNGTARIEDKNVYDQEAKGKNATEDIVKEVKDDEKMLDSGNFELRDARSANKLKPAMDFILEDGEVDVKSSLTDEGFQDMSSGSVSSMKEVLDRPLFIDFTTSKKSKLKKKILERLKQRAKDILNMVTLHEMSYSLFEMKPIPYDLYMATFGRTNYTQTAVQTFDDGITEEIQTDEIISEEKWTQHPIEFSTSDIHLKPLVSRKYNLNIGDYLSKFTILLNKESDVEFNNKINSDKSYKTNPLRMYFEQKDGVGSCEMLPYEDYEAKLKNKQFNSKRLGKFMKRIESRICNILNANTGDISKDLSKNSKCPFSNGYKAVSTKNITDERIQFLKHSKVTGIILSETKSNLIFTVHSNCPNVLANKNVLCLWDVSVTIRNPLKVLIAISNISIARFKGDTCGIFVAGLEDGSIHLWDLSEEPTWHPDVTSANPTEMVEMKAELTPSERDGEWNSNNVHVGFSDSPSSQCLLQASSYTTSASLIQSEDTTSPVIAGLVLDTNLTRCDDSSRKVLGQVYALQRIGIVTIWSIIQDKMRTSNDIGKAYWSKMKLEKSQTISLIEHLTITRTESLENIFEPKFNFNAAKSRLSMRRREKNMKRQFSRQKSAAKVEIDRPSSAATLKNRTVLPGNWETGIICTDLKIMRLNNNDNYLVAKNCGEVICFTKSVGVVKMNRFCVATDLSTVTKLEVSPQTPQHFIAATDTGTLSLCSLVQDRVLLTLDCRNVQSAQANEKYQVDTKGRFLGNDIRPQSVVQTTYPTAGISVKSIVWCSNPCWLLVLLSSNTLVGWDLTQSDIYAKISASHAAKEVSASDNALALLTPEGKVQVHSLSCTKGHQYLELFHRYASLL